MAEKFAPDFIANGANSWTPQLTNQFYIQIAIPGVKSLSQSREVYLAVAGGGIPGSSFEEVTIDFVNMQTFMAGAIRFETFALRVRDFIDAGSRQALYDWFVLVGDPQTGKMGLPNQYKTDGNIILFAPNGSAERSWKVEGVWPQAQNWGDLDYSTVENLEMEFTLRCDRAYLAPRIVM